MKHHAHVQIAGRREGRRAVAWEGWVDGAEAIVRCADPHHPTSDPRSAFFGGQGLLPPFRPVVHHEAVVWARVEPTRVVAHGIGPEGPYVALRRLPGLALESLGGAMPFDPACIEAVFLHLATELAALHSAGVLHRDLRPGTVLLVDGRARLAGLASARLDGVGPPHPGGPGSVAGDLAALAAITTWMLAGRSPSILGERLAGVYAALRAPDAAARPASANDLLEALGEPGGPPAAVSPPHPALAAWAGGAWADRLLAQGNVWDVVRRADAADLDRWALAAVAGRLLDVDRGADGWLALGTLCWMLSERTSGSERDAYRAQTEEARARARASWHPAAAGLAALLAGGERVGPLCETQQPRRAAALARREGGGGVLALVGWLAGEPALVEEGLAEAAPDDLEGMRVTASRLLLAAPKEAPTSAARLALPSAQLEAVRMLCAAGNEAEALRLASSFPEPWATRARLIVALAVGEKGESLAIARTLAVRGSWDPTVAAVILAHAPEGEPLRVQARRVLHGVAPREDLAGLRARGVESVATDPRDLVGWSGLLCARVGAGEIERAAAELERAGGAPGAAGWSLFALELVAAGRLQDARALLADVVRRYPDEAGLSAFEAALALLDGDPDVARKAAEHAVAQRPGSPWGWLARAACATWTGEADLARQDLAAAARAGAKGRAFQALEACVPPLPD